MFNENIDIRKAQKFYALHGWVTIEGVLRQDAAEEIWQTLRSDVPWNLFYTRARDEVLNSAGPPEFVTCTRDEEEALTAESEAKIAEEINLRARKWYAFKYYRYNLHKAEQPVLKEFYDALDSEKYYGLIRYISDELRINSRYAIATCYKPSCFLKQHDDLAGNENRKVAHIFGFTKQWQAHWGGMLHFLDNAGNIERVFKPGFNSLMLFKVPKVHFVSQVASFSPSDRYSLTGWFLEP